MAAYYIRFHSYWQDARDWFAGPFASAGDAEVEIDRAQAEGGGSNFVRAYLGQNAPDVFRDVRVAGILTTTAARRVGMRDDWKYNPIESNCIPNLSHPRDISGWWLPPGN